MSYAAIMIILGAQRTPASRLELPGRFEVVDTAPDHFDEVVTHPVIR
jgi:hypothetical protein